MDPKKEAVSIFNAILKSVNPRVFLPDMIRWDSKTGILGIHDQEFEIKPEQKIYVTGAGKAAPTMAEAMERIFGSSIEAGLIIVPPDSEADLKTIKMVQGSHPLPDANSIKATFDLINFIRQIPDNSIVLNLLSGGTSALLCRPVETISIHDIREVYKLLLESGASIQEVNTVRKALSKVKGGRFLEFLKNTNLFDFVISDVPDDDLRFIGSGPTTAQEISYKEALNVAKKYNIWDRLPNEVRVYISEKLNSKNHNHTETSKIEHHHVWIVSSASKVAERTIQLLSNAGYEPRLIHPAWSGLIDDFENHITQNIEKLTDNQTGKQALVFYGECTVKIKGEGLGGRNQELALRMAKRLKDFNRNITFLSAGTDGIDGPTNAAGAVIDEKTYHQAIKKGINPEKYITDNDSYHFFETFGGHIITGPTGNNVMDIQIALLDD